VLRYEDTDDPRPLPGHAIVRLEAVGVNFIDVYQRTGLYPLQTPFVPGQEGSGTVTAVASDVRDVQPGARVAYCGVQGSYAELASVRVDRLAVLPDGLSTTQGAAAMLQGMTAHYLATTTFPLTAGQTCVVHAAAGGVGLLLCQIAKRRGARVIGTTSTREKAALAREAGADEVILYSEQDLETEVKRLTGSRGVQVIYDSVGRSTFAQGLNCLAPRGMMVLFGQSSGPVGPLDPQLLNQKGSLFLTRPKLQDYIATRSELLARSSELFGWVASGVLKLRIGGEYPLREAARAHRNLEARATTGKLLLIP